MKVLTKMLLIMLSPSFIRNRIIILLTFDMYDRNVGVGLYTTARDTIWGLLLLTAPYKCIVRFGLNLVDKYFQFTISLQPNSNIKIVVLKGRQAAYVVGCSWM